MNFPTKAATSFAPGHITGFFCIHDNEDYSKKGSTGCGIVIDGGVLTTVQYSDDLDQTTIVLNDQEVQGGVIKDVVHMLTDIPLLVKIKTNIPIGCGFGASGAGALSTAHALNSVLSLNLTSNTLTKIAHIAEVKNKSGLGDVIAQSHGGIVIRLNPGEPAYSQVDWIPSTQKEIICLTVGKMDTSSVISNSDLEWRISTLGKTAMNKLKEKPTIETFVQCSKNFAFSTGLISDKVLDIIEAVESVDALASQAMLGESVFCISDSNNRDDLIEILSEFGMPLIYNIFNSRAGLV